MANARTKGSIGMERLRVRTGFSAEITASRLLKYRMTRAKVNIAIRGTRFGIYWRVLQAAQLAFPAGFVFSILMYPDVAILWVSLLAATATVAIANLSSLRRHTAAQEEASRYAIGTRCRGEIASDRMIIVCGSQRFDRPVSDMATLNRSLGVMRIGFSDGTCLYVPEAILPKDWRSGHALRAKR